MTSVPPDASGRILVVDDESALRTLTARILARLGYETELACDGQEAVERFAEFEREDPGGFDLIVLDLMMPRMNGIEALREIHQIRPDQPVLLVSGYGESELFARLADHRDLKDGDGRRFGRLIRFLEKPFSTSQFREAVAASLDAGPSGPAAGPASGPASGPGV